MALTGDTGNGTTLTFSANMGFGASSATMDCINITQGQHTVGVVDVSTLATTDAMESIPSDLRELGECTATFRFMTTTVATAAVDAALPGVAGSIVLTYPSRVGDTTSAANITGSGFVTGYTPPAMANGELQVGEVTWKYDGETGPTFTGSA